MIRKSRFDKGILFFNNAIMAVFLLVVLYPLWVVVVSSISEPAMVAAGKVWLWPVNLSLQGYKAVFEYKLIMTGFYNSFVLMALGTVITMAVTILGAYPLSRRDLAGKKPIQFLFVFTMFFGGGLIPYFILIKDLKLLDSLWSLILPSTINVWNIILMRTYFQSNIPDEINNAAKIDGCDDFTFLLRIAVPLSTPIIAVLALFTAVGYWNSYFSALMFINNTAKFPLQLVLRDILITNQTDPTTIGQDVLSLKNKQALIEALKYSVIVVSSLPLMALYPFVQKFFVKGMIVGSLKG